MSPRKSTGLKNAARAYAAAHDVDYHDALLIVRGARRDSADPTDPVGLGAGVAQAVPGHTEVASGQVPHLGRPVQVWEAEIEICVAALDREDAASRIYRRHPWHRTGYLPEYWDAALPRDEWTDPIEDLAPGGMTIAERDHLVAGYPIAALEHAARRSGDDRAFRRAHLVDYAACLTAARERHLALAEGRDGDWEVPATRGIDAIARRRLDLFRAVMAVQFVAEPDLRQAHRRALELAATIPDHTGQPAGIVLTVRPEPCNDIDDEDPQAALRAEYGDLWEDFQAADGTVGAPAAIAAVLGHAIIETLDALDNPADIDVR